MVNLLIVIDKDSGKLGPSETFLRCHIKRLTKLNEALVGNPCLRRFYSSGQYLQSQFLIARMYRWLERKLTNKNVLAQDARAVAKYIRKNRYSKVMAEYGPTGTTVMHACELANVPLIVHFHGWDAYSYYMTDSYGGTYREMFKKVEGVIAVSTDMKQQLISLGCPEKLIFVNPCGADLDGKEQRKYGDQVRRFIMVGRLTPKKAPLTTLKAFKEVLRSYPDISLDVIGDGPLRGDIESYILKNGLKDSVTLYGARDHDFVVRQLIQSDCFLQHSVRAEDGDHEGTPVGVLEAMTIGLPVISTRHGGIMDVIDEGRTGLLVDEHDQSAMSIKMKQLIEDPAEAVRLGERARESALENNTASKSLDDLESYIKKL